MDDLTSDSTPEMKFSTLWDSSSLGDNRTVVNIALNYSRATGNSVYLYWAVTNSQPTNRYVYIIRGEPERAPNTRETRSGVYTFIPSEVRL